MRITARIDELSFGGLPLTDDSWLVQALLGFVSEDADGRIGVCWLGVRMYPPDLWASVRQQISNEIDATIKKILQS